MKIYYALYFNDLLICISDELEKITYYLHQKSTLTLEKNYKIKRLSKIYDLSDYLLKYYGDYLMTEKEFRKVIEFTMKQKEMYSNTLDILEYLKDYSDDQKEIKRLSKAIDIVKSYEYLFESATIKDIGRLSVRDLSEQYELDQLFKFHLQED